MLHLAPWYKVKGNFQMNIGQLASKAGVNPQTIRYYEREGILPAPARRAGSNYRDYSETTLETLGFIKNAQAAGFKLSQIHQILVASARHDSNCDEVQRMIRQRRAEVAEKLRTLHAFQRTLSKMEQACQENAVDGCCPTLRLLHATGKANQ